MAKLFRVSFAPQPPSVNPRSSGGAHVVVAAPAAALGASRYGNGPNSGGGLRCFVAAS